MGFLSNIFEKKRFEDVIVAPPYINNDKTAEENQILKRQIMEMTEQYDKLIRIMKYADFTSDQPTFHLKSTRNIGIIDPYMYLNDNVSIIRSHNKLYIYVNREEYEIELTELNKYTTEKLEGVHYYISTTNDPGLLLFECCVGVIPINYTQHKFIIDYKQGHYVHSQEDIRKGEATYEEDK